MVEAVAGRSAASTVAELTRGEKGTLTPAPVWPAEAAGAWAQNSAAWPVPVPAPG